MTQIAPSAIAGGLSSSLLQRLDSIESVPLSELEQLRTELQVVGKIVAQQAPTLCDDQLHHIARALQEQLGACEDAGLHELGLADPVAGKAERPAHPDLCGQCGGNGHGKKNCPNKMRNIW